MIDRPFKDKNKKAAALSYNKNADAAPRVVAAGKGLVAEKILKLAKEQNITVYKDPALVETLVQLDIGWEIPPELYQAVAEILAFIYKLDGSNTPDNQSNSVFTS